MKKVSLLFRKLGVIMIVLFAAQTGYSQQDAYFADTTPHKLFKNFVGLKLFAGDFGATGVNKDLEFYYVSVNPAVGYKYTFLHDFNVKGVHNFFNAGLGLEENLGNHLSINFFNASIGYLSNVLNWNVGVGVGYFVSLNKDQTWRMNGSLNIYYQNIAYGFGNYYDTTLLGFVVDGVNVGTSITNVKYVNSIFSLSPGLEIMYRKSNWDFYADVYYNYVFSYYEKVTFYVHSIPIVDAIYYTPANPNAAPTVPVSRNALNLNMYTINIGVIREFGL